MKQVTTSIAAALPEAAKAFAIHGFEQTRIEHIVAATGIPKPTLYYHFSSKEEILSWLLEALLQELAAEIGVVMDSDAPARDRLNSILATYLELFAERPELCSVLLRDLGRISRIPVIADSVRAAFHEPVCKVLEAGLDDGSIRRVDGRVASSAIFGMVTMVGLHYVVAGDPIPVPEVIAQLDDLLERGLSPDRDSAVSTQRSVP